MDLSFARSFGIGPVLEILVLAAIFYYMVTFFRGTRSAQVLFGLILVTAVFIGLTYVFHLYTLNWLFRHLSVYLAIGLVVIFQPEIRRALAELGKPPVFTSATLRNTIIDHLVEAARVLAERRIGALIAVEQEIGTRAVQESGVRLDAAVSADLLVTLFYPQTPLHDGGVIVRGDRILAAGCEFPLSQRSEPVRGLGTRHRAAMGLTEETDAVVVVVSEETGVVSVSYGGRLSRDLGSEQLRRFLSALLHRGTRQGSAWERAKEQLDITPAGIAAADAGKDPVRREG